MQVTEKPNTDHRCIGVKHCCFWRHSSCAPHISQSTWKTVFAVQVGSLAWQIVHSTASSSSLELSQNRAGNWRCRLGWEKLGSLLQSCSPDEMQIESELESEFTARGSSLGRAIGFFMVRAAGWSEPFFSFQFSLFHLLALLDFFFLHCFLLPGFFPLCLLAFSVSFLVLFPQLPVARKLTWNRRSRGGGTYFRFGGAGQWRSLRTLPKAVHRGV